MYTIVSVGSMYGVYIYILITYIWLVLMVNLTCIWLSVWILRDTFSDVLIHWKHLTKSIKWPAHRHTVDKRVVQGVGLKNSAYEQCESYTTTAWEHQIFDDFCLSRFLEAMIRDDFFFPGKRSNNLFIPGWPIITPKLQQCNGISRLTWISPQPVAGNVKKSALAAWEMFSWIVMLATKRVLKMVAHTI